MSALSSKYIFILPTIFFIVSAFLFTACSTNIELPPENEMIIPLAEGNYWVYEIEFNPSSDGVKKISDTLMLKQEYVEEGNQAWKFLDIYPRSGFPYASTLFFWYDHISIDSLGTYYTCYVNRVGCNERAEFKFPELVSDTLNYSYIGFPDEDKMKIRRAFITEGRDEYPGRIIYQVETEHSNNTNTIFFIASGIGIIEWRYISEEFYRKYSLKDYSLLN